jgi:hypothetical protein
MITSSFDFLIGRSSQDIERWPVSEGETVEMMESWRMRGWLIAAWIGEGKVNLLEFGILLVKSYGWENIKKGIFLYSF